MKKIIFFINLLFALAGFYSCERNLESEGVSDGVVNFPNIVLNGDQYLTILVGQTYQDKGAKAYSGVTDISDKMTTEGNVDINTTGVYLIKYSVTNEENKSLSITRYVGVITQAAAAMDISGKYVRTVAPADPNRSVNVIKKDYPGLYTNDNPGGVRTNVDADAPFFVTVYMFQTDVTVVSVPPQSTALGQLSCISGTYNTTTKAYSWKVVNPSFGTSARTFVKQ